MTWTMPAEWTPHKRTWMAWPHDPFMFDPGGVTGGAHKAWSGVANAIAKFEPVIMVCNPGESTIAREFLDHWCPTSSKPSSASAGCATSDQPS